MSAVTGKQAGAAVRLVAAVLMAWPNANLTSSQQEQYARDVAELDMAEARVALEVIKRRGGRFAPTAGEIILEVARMQVDAPDWAEVKRQLVRRQIERQNSTTPIAWKCPHGLCDGSGLIVGGDRNPPDSRPCECRLAKIAAKRREDHLHPLVREFVSQGYVTWGEVELVALGNATTLESQMREKWRAFAARAVESRAIGTIDGPSTLLRLSQAAAEDAPRRPNDGKRHGLKTPDYLKALEPAS